VTAVSGTPAGTARTVASARTVRSARRIVSSLLCLLLLLAPFPGCVTKQSVRPDAFDTAAGHDIHVYMKERRMVEFEGGSYRSIDSAGTRYLVGNGVDYRPDSAIVRVPFSGYLPFSAIDRIETHRVDVYSALYVTFFIGLFAVIGFSTHITD
jgi:hypothetical protein